MEQLRERKAGELYERTLAEMKQKAKVVYSQ